MFNLCVYVNKPGWLCGLVIPLGRTENAWIKTVVLGPWEMVMKFITVMRSKQICEGTVFFFRFINKTSGLETQLQHILFCSLHGLAEAWIQSMILSWSPVWPECKMKSLNSYFRPMERKFLIFSVFVFFVVGEFVYPKPNFFAFFKYRNTR